MITKLAVIGQAISQQDVPQKNVPRKVVTGEFGWDKEKDSSRVIHTSAT